MKILFLSRWVPYPTDNGSKIRVFNLIKHLSARHTVDLVSFTSERVSKEQHDLMCGSCRRIDSAPFLEFQPGRLKAVGGLFSPKPRLLIDTHSAEMERLVRQSADERYDVVIASQLAMVPYADLLPGQPRIFEEIELTTFYENFNLQSHPLKRFRGKLTWWKVARFVAGVLSRYAGGTVVSEIERGRVEQALPGFSPIEVVPNGVDLAALAGNFGQPEPGSLVFSGSLTYDANFDAVDYFLREIFPTVRLARPDTVLYVTGRLDGVPVDRLPAVEGVVYTGHLPDVRPRVARSWVSVVPIRKGGGTRLKILEALALGTPVVSTLKGMEGLDLEPGKHLLAAPDAEGFAAAVLRLLGNPAARFTFGSAGKQAVMERYDWQKIGPAFVDFVEQVGMEGQNA